MKVKQALKDEDVGRASQTEIEVRSKTNQSAAQRRAPFLRKTPSIIAEENPRMTELQTEEGEKPVFNGSEQI